MVLITHRRNDPYIAHTNQERTRMKLARAVSPCSCVFKMRPLAVFYLFFFYLLLTISLKENERKFASGLILCETARSPVICGTPHANIHEFSPGGGDSAPCADPGGGTPQSQVIWVSIEISIWTPLENVGPPLDPWKSSFYCNKTIGPPL